MVVYLFLSLLSYILPSEKRQDDEDKHNFSSPPCKRKRLIIHSKETINNYKVDFLDNSTNSVEKNSKKDMIVINDEIFK